MKPETTGVVVQVAEGRGENLAALLDCLRSQRTRPAQLVVVRDGERAPEPEMRQREMLWAIPKWKIGDEPARNVGVRVLARYRPDLTHVWFLDSDLIFEPDMFERLLEAYARGSDRRMLVAPYDWLPPDMRPRPGEWLPNHVHAVRNDPRWAMINANPPHVELLEDLAAALATFSGNLIWPIAEFQRVGGFWSEVERGEDGELGLRAVSMRVPISFAGRARAWHQWHPVDLQKVYAINDRDIPKIDARHPWVKDAGIELGDRDGHCFEVACPACGERMVTNRWWQHAEDCGVARAIPVAS
jgi:hypothetical protein